MGIEKMNHEEVVLVEEGALKYIQFKSLLKFNKRIVHCFTTRLGGVSEGECRSLNMGFNRNDERGNVERNYQIIASALGIDNRSLVFSNQVHEARVRVVNEDDKGKGIVRTSDIIGYDGLATNTGGVPLVTFYADCVPVFFYDPVKNAIALSHSGWRGTVKEIARETVKVMEQHFGSKPEDMIAAIGPSIGKCCFEVGNEVYEEFVKRLDWSKKFCDKAYGDKWNIDLQGIIKETLIRSGVHENEISVAGMCTRCNNDLFFSHRGDHGKTGSLAAIMQIL